MIHTLEHRAAIRSKVSKAVHPAKLLSGFLKARKTGELIFREGASERTLFLRNGCIVYPTARILEKTEFGDYLVSRGILTARENRGFRNRAKERGEAPYDLMVEDRILTRAELEEHRVKFDEETLSDVFSMTMGEFAFVECDIDVPDSEVSTAKTASAIVDGIVRHYNTLMISDRLIRRLKTPLRMNPHGFIDAEELRKVPVVARFLAEIRDDRPLKDVITNAGLNSTEGLAVCFGLLTLDVLKFIVPPAKRREIARARKARRRNDPFEKLYKEALASVEQIHERFKDEPRLSEMDVPVGTTNEEIFRELGIGADAPRELRERVARLLDLKRQRRAMLDEEGAAGEDAVATIAPGAGGEADAADDETGLGGAGLDLGGEDDEDIGHEIAEDFDAGFGADESFTDFVDDQTNPMDDYGIGDPTQVHFSPEEPDDTVYNALRTYSDEGRWDIANAAFEELKRRGSTDAGVLAYGGWVKYHLSNADPFGVASALIQEAINAQPAHDVPYLIMGKLYFEEGDKGMAELYLVKAVEKNSDCYEAKDLVKKIYETR
ncbi:DUF4388 domain-containing protein [bacterium]|nr:DUF4388 domain-containing protein [bacterium]